MGHPLWYSKIFHVYFLFVCSCPSYRDKHHYKLSFIMMLPSTAAKSIVFLFYFIYIKLFPSIPFLCYHFSINMDVQHMLFCVCLTFLLHPPYCTSSNYHHFLVSWVTPREQLLENDTVETVVLHWSTGLGILSLYVIVFSSVMAYVYRA
jgi:hypothetical protein